MSDAESTPPTSSSSIAVVQAAIDHSLVRNGVAVDSDPPERDRAFHRLEVQDDDAATTYSYFSTWSSNYTASNLPGPGRILGNLYDWAGSTLWRRSPPAADTNTQPGVQQRTFAHRDSR